jgi:hypothetical protein
VAGVSPPVLALCARPPGTASAPTHFVGSRVPPARLTLLPWSRQTLCQRIEATRRSLDARGAAAGAACGPIRPGHVPAKGVTAEGPNGRGASETAGTPSGPPGREPTAPPPETCLPTSAVQRTAEAGFPIRVTECLGRVVPEGGLFGRGRHFPLGECARGIREEKREGRGAPGLPEELFGLAGHGEALAVRARDAA